MIATLLRLVAVSACTVVGLSFVLFAVEETDKGSKSQVQKLTDPATQPAPAPAAEREREKLHGSAREAIDDANDIVLMPFAGYVDFKSNWATRGLLGLIGVLVYGLGLTLFANYLPKEKGRDRDWRAPSSV